MKHGFLSKFSLLRSQALQIKALKKERDYLRGILAQTDYLPVPPQELRVRVGGWDDADHFLGVGRKIFWDLKRLLNGVGKAFESFDSILDFGCGCGRVTRFLMPTDHQTIIGTDIDPESIEWCDKNLSHIATFKTNDVLPPLEFADGTFDFVYCISVFTHLPENMQFRWLEELRRITKPQGFFITSVHGEELFSHNDPQILNDFKEQGFAYITGDGTKGLPEFYQTSFHTEKYIRSRWSKYFNILNVQTRAINNHQVGVVCQR